MSGGRPTLRGALWLMAMLVLAPLPAGAADACAGPADPRRAPVVLPRTRAALAVRHTLTIVALGSSSTAGVGASRPDATYPAQLGKLAQRRTPMPRYGSSTGVSAARRWR